MRIELIEHEGCFAFNLQAESIAEAALLVRFGTNATHEIRTLSACANADGSFTGDLVLAKHRRANNDIPRRR